MTAIVETPLADALLIETLRELQSKSRNIANQVLADADALSRLSSLLDEAGAQLSTSSREEQLRDAAYTVRAAVTQGLTLLAATQARAGQLEGISDALEQLRTEHAYRGAMVAVR